MTDAREQLAHLICTAIQGAGDMWIELRPSTTIDGTVDMLKVADTILAAGWRHSVPRCQWRAHHQPDEGDEYCCGQRVVMVPVVGDSDYDPSG